MSQENVEIVRAAFGAWNAGDMDAFRELLDPDAVVRLPEGWPEPGPFVGQEAVMRQFAQLRETWDADALVPISDVIDGSDHVVVRFIWRGAGRGPEAALEMTGVYTVRKSKLFVIEHFWDHAEALEAVGLSEQALSRENVEVVQAVFEAWNAPDMDAWRELHDPAVIMRNPEGWPEPGPFVGLEAVMRNFEQAREIWDTDAVEPVSDFIDAGDRVLVRMIWRGVGRGPESHLEFTIVFTVRKHKVFHIEFFWDHAEALEALGLSEQAAHAADS